MSSPHCEGPLAQAITKDLQDAVDDFNNRFKAWCDKHGCVADIGWSYKEGKALEIRSIDLPVFKRPLPNATPEPFVKMSDVQKA